MAKHGLPIYPIYDEMLIAADQTQEEIEWCLEHGMICRSLFFMRDELLVSPEVDYRKDFPDIPKSCAGLPLAYQDVTKYQGEYVFIAMDTQYRGDGPRPEHYIARKYKSLNELVAREQISFTDWVPWKWLDWKPDLLRFYSEEVVYSLLEGPKKDEQAQEAAAAKGDLAQAGS